MIANRDSIIEDFIKNASGNIELQERILSMVDTDKLLHTLEVVRECERLGKAMNLISNDVERLVIAALMHDIDKNKTNRELIMYILANGKKYNKVKIKHESLHAISASIRLKKEFKVNDSDIKNAIRYHSIPRANSSVYEKILYISDWLVHSDQDPDAMAIRELVREKKYDDAMSLGIKCDISNRLSRNKHIHPRYLEAYNFNARK